MGVKTIILAAVAVLLVLLYINILVPRGGLSVYETRCPENIVWRFKVKSSSGSYGIMYDKDSVRLGESVCVKLWVFSPGGESSAVELFTASLGPTTVGEGVRLERRGVYLEKCIRVVPHRSGTLVVRWRHLKVEISVRG